ncbi:hypothetical protein FRC01_008282 [Tulasnella sp. 417]|nr:hypothetical protein FRC01_008282 [Tulasnella sp. 417]
MKLQPNIGSDRSWVWKVAADISDGEPQAETLAIRFANADNAGLFKEAFENAQKKNEGVSDAAAPKADEAKSNESPEDAEKKEEAAAPSTSEPAPAASDTAGNDENAAPASTEAKPEAASDDKAVADLAKEVEAVKVEDKEEKA